MYKSIPISIDFRFINSVLTLDIRPHPFDWKCKNLNALIDEINQKTDYYINTPYKENVTESCIKSVIFEVIRKWMDRGELVF